MFSLTILITLLFLFVVSNLKKFKTWWCERRRKIELAEKIPGPKGLPIFGNILTFSGTQEQMQNNFFKEAQIGFENNEPLRRYWIGSSLTVQPLSSDAAKVIFDSTTEISKGETYDFYSQWLGNGLVLSDGEKWKYRRRLITPSFHFNMLKKYFETYNNESKNMVEIFESLSKRGDEVEIFNVIKRSALDIICETAMGVKVNASKNPNHPYLIAVKKYAKLSSDHFRNIFYKIPLIYYLFGDQTEKDRLLVILKSFTRNVIKQKTEEFEKNNGMLSDNTFLSTLLQLKKENNWSDEDVREEVETFIFAGHDTTSSLVSYLFWALSCYQDIQQKVYEEIYDVYGDEERDVLPEDLPKLTYLEMVIKETLRRYSTVPFFVRMLTNEIEVCGYTLPKGTNFIFAPQHTNFNSNVFPDPYKFDPDRFLPEIAATRNAYDFTPFSAGTRNCIGQRFALNEAKTIAIWILRHFKLTTKREESYVKSIAEATQTPVDGIPIIFEKRKTLSM
uniref:Cytochrome P450 n=1 Tax=Strongyloides stercoralis TaxID=6248 RepID=A0A0K0EFV1_STRER